MRYGKRQADIFRKLPDRAQEVWFRYCERLHEVGMEHYIGTSINLLPLWDYSKCQSPIETIYKFTYDILSITEREFWSSMMIPQYEVETKNHRYYIDFAFIDEISPLKLAIECDGHEFHEKTKEQVAKDNEREYELKMLGYEVLRFSGSQIFNNPISCVSKTMDFIQEKRKKEGYNGDF